MKLKVLECSLKMEAGLGTETSNGEGAKEKAYKKSPYMQIEDARNLKDFLHDQKEA